MGVCCYKNEKHKQRLDEMFDEIRKMDVTPFGYILDFLIEQGLSQEQATNWFNDRSEYVRDDGGNLNG